MELSRPARNLTLCAAIVALTAAALYVGYRFGRDTPTDARLAKQIDQRVEQHLDEKGLTGKNFSKRVRDEIEAWVAERQRAANDTPKADAQVPPVRAEDHVRGNPDARISLIEYSDFECPYCKRFHGTAVKLVERYEGRVNWVYRHFPISSHDPAASQEAEATECAAELAGNEAFWQLGDAIFERTRSNGRGVPGGLAPLAEQAGVDRSAFTECLESGRMAERVQRDLQEGQQAGVRGTPGNFLVDRATGEVLSMTGARPLDQFEAAVDRLLESDAE